MAAQATSGLVVNKGMCPSCDGAISWVEIERLDIREGPLPKWTGVSLICPHCQHVLGVSVDPIALKDDIVETVLHQLRKK